MTKNYLSKAARHYNKLFTLPRYRVLLIFTLFTCLSGSIISFTMISPNLEGGLKGLIFGFQVLVFPLVIIDFLSREIIKSEIIFNLKRSAALSLVICLVYMLIIFIGSLLQVMFLLPMSLYYATFFSICITVAIRFLVLRTVTYLSNFKLILLTIVQPFTSFISNMAFWGVWSKQIVVASLLSTILLIVTTQLLIHIINRKGVVVIGIGSIHLFKSFLSNWLENFTSPLEKHLEKLGTDTDVSVDVFAFRKQNKIKAMLVIPNIHPGPFRNLGSSNLPSMIQHSFESKFDIITAVPHGLSSHELDLTSQSQCDKVLKELLNANLVNFSVGASKAIRVNRGSATAICQLFGKSALLTVTCAPKSMEDLPLEVGVEIVSKNEDIGVKNVSIIDAHNSIGDSDNMPVLSEEEVQDLVVAATEALRSALKEDKQNFFVGIAKVVPNEFTIDQGIGPGGIVTLVVGVRKQKFLYVTIDGNNMVSGLREKIIQSLSNWFDDCEVLTTDTHFVNAISTIKGGYYPIGKAVDNECLVSYIKDTAAKAIDNLEIVDVSFARVIINNVKVIGEKKLATLSMLIDSSFSLLKRLSLLIYIPAILIAILPFLFIQSI